MRKWCVFYAENWFGTIWLYAIYLLFARVAFWLSYVSVKSDSDYGYSIAVLYRVMFVHLLETWFNTLGPRQNGRHFPEDILKCIFLNENVWISIRISLKFVPKGPINNIPALVQITAWRRPGDKPLSEAMIINLPTHICVPRPQRVKPIGPWGTRL